MYGLTQTWFSRTPALKWRSSTVRKSNRWRHVPLFDRCEERALLSQVSGAIFTTTEGGTTVNANIYGDKSEVWLNGGPAHPGAAGLTPGDYYVQVTDPSGSVALGTSVGTANQTPIHVVSSNDILNGLYPGKDVGDFAALYQVSTIVVHTGLNGLGDDANGGAPRTSGYDTTPNPGGEYKIWVSTVSTFDNDDTKTDNFKIKEESTPPHENPEITGIKFYDANANGVYDPNSTTNPGEVPLADWVIKYQVGNGPIQTTSTDDTGKYHIIVDEDGLYTISEGQPQEAGWKPTAPQDTNSGPGSATATGGVWTVAVTTEGPSVNGLDFGNLCLGAGNGLTKGFWSNKNGQGLITDSDITGLIDLRLRKEDGTLLLSNTAAIAANKSALQQFLASNDSSASNMAAQLSAQLAAMYLNVQHHNDPNITKYGGGVDPNALIYAPGTDSANPLGYAKVQNVTVEATVLLNGLNSSTGKILAGDPNRLYAEALKNALDNANNNLTFVLVPPPIPPFSFA